MNQFLASRNTSGTLKQTGWRFRQGNFAIVSPDGRCGSAYRGDGPQVFLLAVLDHALRANSTLVDRVDLVTKAYRCPLHRLRVPRLLLPRSGLERSDFVLWHFLDKP